MNSRGALATLFFVGFVAMSFRALNWDDLDLNKAASGGMKLFHAAQGMTDIEETELGRDVAANLAARYGFVQDADAVRYVNLVGRSLATHSVRPGITYHFAILKTTDINALSAPGGYIFVTRGLIQQIDDEAELAGVLAHEISHVEQRHVVTAIRKANLVGAGTDLASASGHSVDDYAKLTDFTVNLMDNGFSRNDELEADQLGTILAARTGYDATGLRRCVEHLGAQTQKVSTLAAFNKTHPPTADRLKAIDKTLHKNKLTSDGALLAARFRTAFPVVAVH